MKIVTHSIIVKSVLCLTLFARNGCVVGSDRKLNHFCYLDMFLNAKTSSAYLFFEWRTDSFVGLITGMIVTTLLGFIFESLYLFGSKLPHIKRHESDENNKRNVTVMLMQSALHILRVIIGYILMLCVMTMNLWILASVLVGGGVGYFLFRPWSFTKKVKNGNGNIIQVRETTKPLLAKESFV